MAPNTQAAPPPPPPVDRYSKKYLGYFGMLGEYETQVKYIQSSFNLEQLADIKLVDNIISELTLGFFMS